jgi:hypothetical protein
VIDWNLFGASVPAGTIARSVWQFDVVLLENYPYAAMEENIKFRAERERVSFDHQEIGEDKLKCQRIISENSNDIRLWTFIQPDCLKYFIDSRWQTFEEMMGLR